MTRGRFLVGLLVAVAGVGCGGPGLSRPVTIRYATSIEEVHPTVTAMKRFAERLEELSGGELRVEVRTRFGANGHELLEACRQGQIDMGVVTASTLAQQVPLANIFTMPFLFRDEAHLAAAMADEPGRRLREEARRVAGLRITGFYTAGMRSITTQGGPIRRPEDLRGLKIRVMESEMMVETLTAMGASGIPMNYGEIYGALQRGELDGWENNANTILNARTIETGCNHLAWTRHLAMPDLAFASLGFYERLTRTQRAWLEQAMAETTAEQGEQWRRNEAEAVAQLEAAGMRCNEVEREAFAGRMQALYERAFLRQGREFEELFLLIREM